jgi:hypothetical protein
MVSVNNRNFYESSPSSFKGSQPEKPVQEKTPLCSEVQFQQVEAPASAYKANFMPSFGSLDILERNNKLLNKNLQQLESLVKSDDQIIEKMKEYRPFVEEEHDGLLTDNMDMLIMLAEEMSGIFKINKTFPQEIQESLNSENVTQEEISDIYSAFVKNDPVGGLKLFFHLKTCNQIKEAISDSPMLYNAVLSDFLETLNSDANGK